MQKDILRDLSYGIYVVGTEIENKNIGCIANSAMQITSNPITIAISINHDNETNKAIKASGRFSLSILKESTDQEIIRTFGYYSSKERNKYEKIDFEEIDKTPVIKDSCGYVVCKVIATLETSTHTIFLGEAIAMKQYQVAEPMTYRFYHQKLKGTTPKNAPTYQENDIKKEITENRWRCKVCGYIYNGEELPKDFICPICKASYEMFEKI